jgi:hypothetical protein
MRAPLEQRFPAREVFAQGRHRAAGLARQRLEFGNAAPVESHRGLQDFLAGFRGRLPASAGIVFPGHSVSPDLNTIKGY